MGTYVYVSRRYCRKTLPQEPSSQVWREREGTGFPLSTGQIIKQKRGEQQQNATIGKQTNVLQMGNGCDVTSCTSLLYSLSSGFSSFCVVVGQPPTKSTKSNPPVNPIDTKISLLPSISPSYPEWPHWTVIVQPPDLHKLLCLVVQRTNWTTSGGYRTTLLAELLLLSACVSLRENHLKESTELLAYEREIKIIICWKIHLLKIAHCPNHIIITLSHACVLAC